jgi:hypothetical protein
MTWRAVAAYALLGCGLRDVMGWVETQCPSGKNKQDLDSVRMKRRPVAQPYTT